MVEEIENLIAIQENQVETFKKDYHKLINDFEKGYLVERAKGYLVGAQKQLKLTKDWFRELKKQNSPKEINYLDGGKIEYIYESKLNYEKQNAKNMA